MLLFGQGVFIFAALFGQQTTTTFLGDLPGDRFGEAARSAGDVNGDGIPDLIVGAPQADGNGVDSGLARVFSGADGVVLYSFVGDGPGDQYGWSVSGAGDVNGDGRADLLIGALQRGIGNGYVHVRSGADGSVIHRLFGSNLDAYFASVSGIGDVNQDGCDDFMVGAYGEDANGVDSGAVRVFDGNNGAELYSLVGADAGDWLGYSVAALEDQNADGVPDLLIGAPNASAQHTLAGQVLVHSGRDGVLLFRHEGAGPSDRLGFSVSTAGDQDSDGVAEFVAGAPQFGGASGYARVYSGSTLRYSLVGDHPRDEYGIAVSGGGDVDGDGVPDVLVGADQADRGLSGVGMVRVHSGVDGAELLSEYGDEANDHLGRSVAVLGDLNSDQRQDYVAGAIGSDTHGTDSGLARVFGVNLRPLEQFSKLRTFGPGDLSFPQDLAVFAACRGSHRWVFVLDGDSSLKQYRWSTQGTFSLFKVYDNADGDFAGFGARFYPVAIAANDLPDHSNHGQVYLVGWANAPQGAPGSSPAILIFRIRMGPVLNRFELEFEASFQDGGGTLVVNESDSLSLDAKGDLYHGRSWDSVVRKYRSVDLLQGSAPPVATIAVGTGILSDSGADLWGKLYAAMDGDLYRFDDPASSPSVMNNISAIAVNAGEIQGDPWISRGGASIAERRNGKNLSESQALTAPGKLIDEGRLEFKRSWTTPTIQDLNSNRKIVCLERLFVLDDEDAVKVFGKNTLSARRPVGAVAWWRFERFEPKDGATVRDALDKNHGSIVVLSPDKEPSKVPGMVRCGISFRSGAMVIVPDDDSLDFGKADFTIEGWLRSESASGIQTLVEKIDTNSPGYAIKLDEGRLKLDLNGGGATWNYQPQQPLVADGCWHHFAFVVQRSDPVDAASVVLYVDGAQVGAPGFQPPLGSVSNSLQLWISGQGFPDPEFEGQLDELTFYDRALYSDELEAIAEAGCAGKDLPPASGVSVGGYVQF